MKAKLTITVEVGDDGQVVCGGTCVGRLRPWEHGRMFAAAVGQITESIRQAAEQYSSAGKPACAASFLAACCDLPAGSELISESGYLREVPDVGREGGSV